MSLRAFGLACSIPWAIQPEALRQILEISTREHVADFEAVAAKRARRLDGTEDARMRDGVGIIDITGPIFRYADFFTDISGGATIGSMSRDFTTALNDPNVKAILLNIDSPGGEVAGTHEFAQMVFAARGKKPIVAYVDGMAASAAYWIASAADEIVTDATGILGSIGVIATVPNPSARSVKEISFVSSQSPKKRPDPTTESGKDQMQNLVDRLADVFVGTVARNRDVNAETVLTRFGQGDVCVGTHAVHAGLADRLGSFEGTVAELASDWKPKRKKMAAFAAEDYGVSRFENLKTRLMAAIKAEDGEKPEEALAETEGELVEDAVAEKPTDKEQSVPTEGAPAKAYAAAEVENRELRAELAAQKAAQTKAEIVAFLDAAMAVGKFLPAERAQLEWDLLQAAQDDLLMPLTEGSRLANKQAAINTRQAHGLFEEKIVDGRHKVLKADENNQTELSEERKAELLKMTPQGRAALSLVK